MALTQLLACILGPRLYRIHRTNNPQGRNYTPNALEGVSDNFLQLLNLTWSLGVYTSPVLLFYLYRKGYVFMGIPTGDNASFYVRLGATLAAAIFGAAFLRGVGRLTNSDYLQFLASYDQVKRLTPEEIRTKKQALLSGYDFDFSKWPVEFIWQESSLSDHKKPPQPLNAYRSKRSTAFDFIKMLPCDIISFVAVHTFGRRMMYPGSVFLLQKALDPMLREGRNRLQEKYGGERFKLQTGDEHFVDSMFIDRRKSSQENGNTLVICCEGNAGFYEIGIMVTPIEAGYSVLGWNHPGFGGSTGLPFPAAEVMAVDTVVKFAIDRLGFKVENIILFAWSIGGYPASWAAMTHPDVKGLILDASFDDVVPLATAKMPPSWRPLVVNTVRNYFNLNISEQIGLYSGPILFVRRLRDEIINTLESEPIRTNRANDMLIKLFQSRFPKLVQEEDPMWVLRDWLSGDGEHQRAVVRQNSVNEDLCLATLLSYIESSGPSYPLNVGEGLLDDLKVQLVLYLASKHLIDYDSTHCTPLPKDRFLQPWDLFKVASQKASKL